MNTEEIMELVETYADGPHLSGYYGQHRANVKAAIEALVQERDALKEQWKQFEEYDCDELKATQALCDALRTKNKTLRDALKTLYLTCPTTLDCRNFHHSKSEQHSYLDSCKPAADYEAALKQSREALGKTK